MERNMKENVHCTPSMHNVQRPIGTDYLATKLDTVPMLLQIS